MDETPGEWIKRVREAVKLTQPELAELLGVHDLTVTKWETGAQEPEFRALVAVAVFCGTPPPMAYNPRYFEFAARPRAGEIPVDRRPPGAKRGYDRQLGTCLWLLERLLEGQTQLGNELAELKRLHPLPDLNGWKDRP